MGWRQRGSTRRSHWPKRNRVSSGYTSFSLTCLIFFCAKRIFPNVVNDNVLLSFVGGRIKTSQLGPNQNQPLFSFNRWKRLWQGAEFPDWSEWSGPSGSARYCNCSANPPALGSVCGRAGRVFFRCGSTVAAAHKAGKEFTNVKEWKIPRAR